MLKSWRTTAAGVVGGVTIILGELCDLIGVASTQLGTDGMFTLDRLLLGLSLIGIGVVARDNKVTSEEAGAGQTSAK